MGSDLTPGDLMRVNIATFDFRLVWTVKEKNILNKSKMNWTKNHLSTTGNDMAVREGQMHENSAGLK